MRTNQEESPKEGNGDSGRPGNEEDGEAVPNPEDEGGDWVLEAIRAPPDQLDTALNLITDQELRNATRTVLALQRNRSRYLQNRDSSRAIDLTERELYDLIRHNYQHGDILPDPNTRTDTTVYQATEKRKDRKPFPVQADGSKYKKHKKDHSKKDGKNQPTKPRDVSSVRGRCEISSLLLFFLFTLCDDATGFPNTCRTTIRVRLNAIDAGTTMGMDPADPMAQSPRSRKQIYHGCITIRTLECTFDCICF